MQIILALAIIWLGSCSNVNQGDRDEKLNMLVDVYRQNLREKSTKIKSRIIGTEISSDIYSLIIDSKFNEKNERKAVIFLVGVSDCGSCISKGKSIADEINIGLGKEAVHYVSYSRYYKESFLGKTIKSTVYIDSMDIIRKKLNYVETPIFLLFSQDKIIDVHPVYSVEDSINSNAFINSCMKVFVK